MYAKEVKRVLEVPSILDLTADKKLYKIKASKEKAPYITYLQYNDSAGFEAEGERKSTKYFVQIDINSRTTDFTKFKKEIYKQAKLNGWTREGGTYEDYDSQVDLFFCSLRFSFNLKEE